MPSAIISPAKLTLLSGAFTFRLLFGFEIWSHGIGKGIRKIESRIYVSPLFIAFLKPAGHAAKSNFKRLVSKTKVNFN